MKEFLKLIKNTYLSWDKNDPWAKSAVIAYYALFSLPSLLIITVFIAGLFFGREAVQGNITQEISGLIGGGSAEAIEAMLVNATLKDNSVLYIIFGIGMLIFGATGVFFQLQKALNDVWSVRSKETTFLDNLKRRFVSFGMVLAIGLLLLISLVITTVVNMVSNYIGSYYSDFSEVLLEILNFIFSQLFITALFAAIFTMLPDIKIKWSTNLIGAFITALLFLAGKYIIGFYFAKSNPASVYGAAGSVVLIMLWVYYTCLILFFGAEFTVNWALFKKVKIEPNDNATLSYEMEMKELREYKKKVEDDKKKAESLKNN